MKRVLKPVTEENHFIYEEKKRTNKLESVKDAKHESVLNTHTHTHHALLMRVKHSV